MGDGMMATFGIPEVAEDDAERAVRAGIEIQERFARFADEVEATHGERLTARVGVNTGEVVIGAADADLVGDALNVAARLEKACRPGHVLVGDETWRLTRGVLAYESLGEVTVTGRAQPVGTYEVGAGEETVETVAPFVGRDAELARLVAAFERACAERGAVLATVVGSPGLGKTRLSRELAARVTASGGAVAYEIRCDRAGGSTFAPVADLLREAAALGDAESDEASDAHERLGALIRDDGDRPRVVDALAGVLGAAPARSVEETFWAVRRTLESLATELPVLVVIDDIQWAEPILLDLVDHLAEWVTDAPVLLVGLARPEIRDLRPAFVEAGRRIADVVALDGLDSRATEALAAGLLGSALPRELVDRLPASTDGNPLFVRELVRMLVDDGVIQRRDDGAWDLAIDAEAVEVPPTIQSLLATRVERLPADELRVLELASVVGAEFSVGALHALGGDELALPAALERLRRKELVEPTGTYWGDEPLHRFHHVLIRDAAYRRLLKGARADLHRRVGEWTDATASDVIGEHETTIAFHYEQAHRYRTELGTLDDETDRLGRRAAELLDVAARRALDRDDLASAGALASRAIAVLPPADADRRAELLLMACECVLASGNVGAGGPLVEALTAAGAGAPGLAAWADCFRAQLVALTDPEGLVEAEVAATQAAATLRDLGDGAGEAKAQQVRALLLARLGRVGEAEAVLDLALGAARAADDRRRVTAVLGAAPQAALFGPSPVARAGGRCLDVVRLLRITTASPSVEATSTRCQAVLEALRGRFDVSRSMLAAARASLEELGLRHGLLETDLFTGVVELLAGRPGAAVAPLRAAYEGLGTLGVGADAGQAAALLATALLAQGDVDEAELMAAESEALAGQNLKTAIAWRTAKAAVLAARGDVDAGVAMAREAVEIAAATDLVLDHADACVVLADLRDEAGDHAGARSARDDARRLYEAKGATVPAERLTPVRDQPVAVSAPPAPSAAEARPPAVENNASRFMDRLRRAFNDPDRAVLGELLARDRVHEDRRSIVAVVDADDRERVADFVAASEQGLTFVAPEVIAVRGERLALTRMVARTPAGDESARLSVNQLDADGRMVRSVLFDEGDLDAALAELDEWYLAGEGAPHADVLRTVRVVLPVAAVVQEVRVAGDTVLAVCTGADAREAHADVVRVAEGAVVSHEVFAIEDFDAADARLQELGAPPAIGPDLSNRVTRFVLDGLAVCNAAPGEVRAFLETTVTDETFPDVERQDRRRVVSMPEVADAAGWAENLASIYDVFDRVEAEPVAIRGERLAVMRVRCVREPDFEARMVNLYEFDEHDHLVLEIDFDEDDLVAAVGELDRRYYFGEGAGHQRVLQAVGEYAAASISGDFDRMRDRLADDFVVLDHQLLGFGTGDRDYFVDMRRLAEADPDGVNTVVHVNEHALLAVYLSRPITEEGTRYERSGCVVIGVDASDRVDRIEMYGEDRYEDAVARLHELGAPAGRPGAREHGDPGRAVHRGRDRRVPAERRRRRPRVRAVEPRLRRRGSPPHRRHAASGCERRRGRDRHHARPGLRRGRRDRRCRPRRPARARAPDVRHGLRRRDAQPRGRRGRRRGACRSPHDVRRRRPRARDGGARRAVHRR